MIQGNDPSESTMNPLDTDQTSEVSIPAPRQVTIPGAGPFLVPGVTPGTTSPGSMNYPAGAQQGIFFGTDLPPAQAAQMFGGLTTLPEDETEQFYTQPGSPTRKGIEYIQGYLRTVIGQPVRVEFTLGGNVRQDRRGTLLSVGIDYILLREIDSDDIILCDIYSIDFVNIFR